MRVNDLFFKALSVALPHAVRAGTKAIQRHAGFAALIRCYSPGGALPVPERADIVVVGGGCSGTSIALQLARRRAGRIVLLERDGIAAGATGRSSALIRQHYTHAALARMAQRALGIFEHFADAIGGESGFRRTGFLALVGPPDVDSLAANVAMHRRLGIDARLLQPSDLGAGRFCARFPTQDQALLRAGYSGVYDCSADLQPLLGPLPQVPGLHVAAGFSGHGFKLSPVVGELIAEKLLDGRTTLVDIDLFSPNRFAEGRPITSPHGYSVATLG